MSNLDNDHLRVVVIYSGTVWKTKVNTSTKISKLISLSLSHFLGSGTNSKSSKYSAVLVRNRTSLSDKKSVADMGLKDNDEVLLVEHRLPQLPQIPLDLRGPTASEIYEATKHLKSRNIDKKSDNKSTADDLDYSDRFSKDSVRIFISLVETAARILTFAPNGMEVFNVVNKEMKSKLEPMLHSPFVKQLTEMGFHEKMVLKALKMTKMNITKATEWLLEQDSQSKESDQHEDPYTSPSQPSTVFDAFQNLLHSTLKKREENFKINFKHVQKLKQMGYEEQDIENALRETDNNLKAAISWLSRSSSHNTLENKYQSLDSSGSMFKSLMTSEIIQLSLTKTKFLVALLSILEDPQCLGLWLNDCEMGSIFNHIALTHNTESSGGRNIT